MKYILISLIVFCSANCFSQIKIGNITVGNALGEKYLIDCYTHPDTIKIKDVGNECYIMNGNVGVGVYNFEDCVNRCKAFNEDVYKNAISEVADTGRFKVFSKGHTGKFLVPRKPTEIDFIKWLKKNQ